MQTKTIMLDMSAYGRAGTPDDNVQIQFRFQKQTLDENGLWLHAGGDSYIRTSFVYPDTDIDAELALQEALSISDGYGPFSDADKQHVHDVCTGRWTVDKVAAYTTWKTQYVADQQAQMTAQADAEAAAAKAAEDAFNDKVAERVAALMGKQSGEQS